MFHLLFHPTEAIRWDLPHQQQPVIATRLANPLATQANPFSQLSLLLAPEGLPPWLGSQFPPPFLGTLPLNYHCPSGPSTTLLFPHLTPTPNLHSSYWHLQMLSLYIKKKKKKKSLISHPPPATMSLLSLHNLSSQPSCLHFFTSHLFHNPF